MSGDSMAALHLEAARQAAADRRTRWQAATVRFAAADAAATSTAAARDAVSDLLGIGAGARILADAAAAANTAERLRETLGADYRAALEAYQVAREYVDTLEAGTR